jgi:hypothetical protein
MSLPPCGCGLLNPAAWLCSLAQYWLSICTGAPSKSTQLCLALNQYVACWGGLLQQEYALLVNAFTASLPRTQPQLQLDKPAALCIMQL